MPAFGVPDMRFSKFQATLASGLFSAALALALISQPASAQFVCDSDAAGENGIFATALGIGGNFACGNSANAISFSINFSGNIGNAANASGGGSFNTATGFTANASGDDSFNTASGNAANASGDSGSNTATGAFATAFGNNSSNSATGTSANASGNDSLNTASGYTANASGANSSNTATGARALGHKLINGISKCREQ